MSVSFHVLEESVIEPGAEAKKLLVMIKTGRGDGGASAVLGMSLAMSSISSLGIDTTVFLVGEGSVWSVAENVANIEVDGFPPLRELHSNFMEAGGTLTVCSTCTETFCAVPAEGDLKPQPALVMPGIKMVGFTYVAKLLTEASAVTF